MQWLGIAIVFAGIMIEIINNYNLADKILPNPDVRNREGENYKKIVVKDEELTVGYEGNICEGVEGIWWFINLHDDSLLVWMIVIWIGYGRLSVWLPYNNLYFWLYWNSLDIY